jgi:hypothetical protein
MSNNHTKIVELFINEDFDESGIEAISLVSRPAHDETWMAFNKDEQVETLNPYTIVDDNFCQTNPKILELGESYSKLINEGYEVVRVEKMTPQVIHKMNQERFTSSNPNGESVLDTNQPYLVRYKYVGVRDKDNRQFCREMLQAGKVYRIEDIDALSDSVANADFGFYSIFMWRGSYNCRHQWVRLLYKKTKDNGQPINIRNTDKSTAGLVEEQGLGPNLQPNTVPDNQRDKVAPREGSYFSKSRYEKSLKKEQKSYYFDEEKRIIVGAAMVPNKMIHRYDELGNLYYVFFSKASIKKMADKFLRQKRTDETSIEHDGIKLGSDKVFITESWVSEDPIKDKSAAYGFNLPTGTWFVSMKVQDQKVWEMIKKKALTGFSVEGLFAEKSVFSKETKQINQIKEILKSIKDE